jgi:N-acetylmuramoyl-L-alanine amidase
MDPTGYRNLPEIDLFSLCVWREARGCGWLARRGVAHVIKNRVNSGRFGGGSYRDVILKPCQFSSFNHNDPNAGQWPRQEDFNDWNAWVDIQGICFDVYNGLSSENSDPSCGALFYWTPPLTAAPTHAWGEVIETARIGDVHFCKPAPIDIRHITTQEH